MAAPQDEDELHATDVPCYLVRPSDNIYSFFMFVGPTESKKKNTDKCTWDIVMAYILVALNFFMQTVLVWLVFESVVIDNLNWQNGILKLDSSAMGGLFEEKPSKCNEGGALCFVDHTGTYSCSPPSIQLIGRWDELDTNKDGVWSWEEVEANRHELKCKYVVDPQEVFLVLVEMLKLRENLIWLHPDVKAGKMIHHMYFQYIMGDLVICGYRSEDMCTNLLERGFFEKPLKHGTAPRVGTEIESALRYCRNLLSDGGVCSSLLPSTYATWKVQSQAECGEPSYSKFTYTNPGNGVIKSLLEVGYGAPDEYSLAQEPQFRIFKGIILYIWLLLMFSEFKEAWKIITVVMRYPDAAEFGDEAVLMERDPADPEDVRYRIQGITSAHRRMMGILSILRICITTALMFVGMSYIIRTNGYVDLLMNGVTLLFVADVSNILYTQVLREEIRDQTEDIKAMKVPMYGIAWLNARPALLDIVCQCCLMALVYALMTWNLNNVTLPIYNALQCTCLSTGEQCFEAQHFNKPWWDDYWMKTVPGVFKEVDTLKATVPGAAMLFNAGSNIVDQSSATQYHQQLESRIEKIARQNMDLQNLVERLEKEVDAAPLRTLQIEKKTEKKKLTTKKANATKSTTLIQKGPEKGKPMNEKAGLNKALKHSRQHGSYSL